MVIFIRRAASGVNGRKTHVFRYGSRVQGGGDSLICGYPQNLGFRVFSESRGESLDGSMKSFGVELDGDLSMSVWV